MISESDKKLLLHLARESIETYFSSKKPNVDAVKKFSEKQGVFVSIHDKAGKLKGCIGFSTPKYPLYVAIIEAARGAAFADSRFSPLKKEDLDEIKIEISILSKPSLLEVRHYNDYSKLIKIGVDGLIVESSGGFGLLLPQVAVANNFNVQNFLNCVCQKAGLSFNAWKDDGIKVYKFTADVFSE